MGSDKELAQWKLEFCAFVVEAAGNESYSSLFAVLQLFSVCFFNFLLLFVVGSLL